MAPRTKKLPEMSTKQCERIARYAFQYLDKELPEVCKHNIRPEFLEFQDWLRSHVCSIREVGMVEEGVLSSWTKSTKLVPMGFSKIEEPEQILAWLNEVVVQVEKVSSRPKPKTYIAGHRITNLASNPIVTDVNTSIYHYEKEGGIRLDSLERITQRMLECGSRVKTTKLYQAARHGATMYLATFDFTEVVEWVQVATDTLKADTWINSYCGNAVLRADALEKILYMLEGVDGVEALQDDGFLPVRRLADNHLCRSTARTPGVLEQLHKKIGILLEAETKYQDLVEFFSKKQTTKGSGKVLMDLLTKYNLTALLLASGACSRDHVLTELSTLAR